MSTFKNNEKNNLFIGNLLLDKGEIRKGGVISENGVISDIIFNIDIIDKNCFNTYDYSGCIISPGFIDIHIHGGWGYDFIDADISGIKVVADNLIKHGITGFLPTLSCAPINILIKSIKTIIAAISELKSSKILGINIEGPFLNKKMKGGLNDKYILLPNTKILLKILKEGRGFIKNMSIAPELERSSDLIKILKKNNVKVSLGHTMATYEEACKAFQDGASNITHIFNAMKPIHHRDPGIICSALLKKSISVEIIADGIHCAAPVLKMVLSLKEPSTVILISDSMRAAGLADGNYKSGMLDIKVKNKRAMLYDGTLAGSTTLLDEAVKNIVNFEITGIENALKMSTYSPAKLLNILDKKGSIEKGKDADIVILNNNLDVVATIISGELVHSC